ncbi:MAG TPA: NUDIX domain-containing protein [bacterium]|jgi:8-oxo-dGTP pyrophosphatase MutT (NUDIX family)|nr:NUDIX domain-containing protein [bacterium]
MRTEFHLRARAVIIERGHVLLARRVGRDYTFLPGGHVKPGEPLEGSLKRELQEELGADARTENYLGAVEASWQEGPIRHHEINHVFEATVSGLNPDRPPTSMETHLEFLWVAIADLDRHNLLPEPIRELLRRRVQGDPSVWWVGV